MSDDVTTGLIAAGVVAIARAIEGGFSMLAKLFRKKNGDAEKAVVHKRIDDLTKEQAEHEKADATVHATLIEKVDRLEDGQKEMASDIKTLLRRSTDQVKRSGR